MRRLIFLAIALLFIGVCWAGDMKHPSLPRAQHNGEPCLFGQTGCGAATAVPTPSGVPTPPSINPNPQNLAIATDPAYGAVGDAIYSGDGLHLADGTTNHTTTFFSGSGGFPGNAIVGDLIFIDGAGSLGGLYQGTVTAVTSSNTLSITPIPLTNVSNANWVIGRDNTTALQAWLNAIRNTLPPNQPKGYLPYGIYLHRGLDFTEMQNLQIEGAGGSQGAGSMLLCIAPTNPQLVCHDFSGTSSSKISDVAFWNGTTAANSLLGTNVVVGSLPSFSAQDLTFADDAFRSFGNYNVALYGVRSITFLDSLIGLEGDPSRQLYITAINSPNFASPNRGVLATSPQPSSGIAVIGGRTHIGVSGAPALTLDEGNTASLLRDISIRDATVSLGFNATGVVDTCVSGCVVPTTTTEHIELDNVNWQADDPTVKIVNVSAPALDWNLTGFVTYNSGAATGPQFSFVNGFLDSNARLELSPGVSTPAFSAATCRGSTLQTGQAGDFSLNTPCTTTAALFSTISGLRVLNLYPLFSTFTGTAGTATCAQPLQGLYKLVTCSLGGYRETGSAQIYTFPESFFNSSVIETESGCGSFHASASATQLTLPANAAMSSPETCNITVTGQ